MDRRIENVLHENKIIQTLVTSNIHCTSKLSCYLHIGDLWDHNTRNWKWKRICNKFSIGRVCHENEPHEPQELCSVENGCEIGAPIWETSWEGADNHTTLNHYRIQCLRILALINIRWGPGEAPVALNSILGQHQLKLEDPISKGWSYFKDMRRVHCHSCGLLNFDFWEDHRTFSMINHKFVEACRASWFNWYWIPILQLVAFCRRGSKWRTRGGRTTRG